MLSGTNMLHNPKKASTRHQGTSEVWGTSPKTYRGSLAHVRKKHLAWHAAFIKTCVRHSEPGCSWAEFVSTDGFIQAPPVGVRL